MGKILEYCYNLTFLHMGKSEGNSVLYMSTVETGAAPATTQEEGPAPFPQPFSMGAARMQNSCTWDLEVEAFLSVLHNTYQ